VTRQNTDPAAPERETLAWVGHSDLTTELNDGPAPVDDFPFDDAGFPVNVPDRPQPDRPPHRGWWGSTDESAGFHTGPAANNQGVQPMSTTDTPPPDVATVETARATFLHNAEAANEQARAYASEAQTNRDQADRLAASNGTGEHDGEIGRLHQLADGCESNSGLRAAQANAWTEEALRAFDRITAMTGG